MATETTAKKCRVRCYPCNEARRKRVGMVGNLVDPLPKQETEIGDPVTCTLCGGQIFCNCDTCSRTRRKRESVARRAAYLAGDATEKGVLKAIDRGFTEVWNFFL
jgi:hypothetical protein